MTQQISAARSAYWDQRRIDSFNMPAAWAEAGEIKSIRSIQIDAWEAAMDGRPADANPYAEGTSAHQAWAERHAQVLMRPIADRAEA